MRRIALIVLTALIAVGLAGTSTAATKHAACKTKSAKRSCHKPKPKPKPAPTPTVAPDPAPAPAAAPANPPAIVLSTTPITPTTVFGVTVTDLPAPPPGGHFSLSLVDTELTPPFNCIGGVIKVYVAPRAFDPAVEPMGAWCRGPWHGELHAVAADGTGDPVPLATIDFVVA
jgi:hypothetical protein